jgi:hypothetical protein
MDYYEGKRDEFVANAVYAKKQERQIGRFNRRLLYDYADSIAKVQQQTRAEGREPTPSELLDAVAKVAWGLRIVLHEQSDPTHRRVERIDKECERKLVMLDEAEEQDRLDEIDDAATR